MRKLMVQLIIALALAVSPVVGHAMTITGLGLVIDTSNSISPENFELQRQAYINALSDDSLIPEDGTVAIGVWQFSTMAARVSSVVLINSQADKDILINSLSGLVQTAQNTCIGCGINGARADLQIFGIDQFDKVIIDVSTDGFNNEPVNFDPNSDAFLAEAVANALDAGVDQINCLGIGGSADCSFIAGTDSFSLLVGGFSDFEDALIEKIGVETEPPPEIIPEPATALLFGLGIVGLAARRRRD